MEVSAALSGGREAFGLDPRLEMVHGYVSGIRTGIDKVAGNMKEVDLNNRAVALVAKGAFEEAITDCDEAVRRNSRRPEVYSTRSFAKMNAEDWAGAEQDC